MDKRILLIFIILILGVGCLYLIVDNSTEVGHAIASVDRYIVTLPPGFTNFQTHDNSVRIENKYNNEKLNFESVESGNHSLDLYIKKIGEINEDPNLKVINNTTKEIEDGEIAIIYYQDIVNDTAKIDGYFDKFNNTFEVTMSNFEGYNRGEDNLKFIAETLYPDYKKPSE